jgi:hypothetical protein
VPGTGDHAGAGVATRRAHRMTQRRMRPVVRVPPAPAPRVPTLQPPARRWAAARVSRSVVPQRMTPWRATSRQAIPPRRRETPPGAVSHHPLSPHST